MEKIRDFDDENFSENKKTLEKLAQIERDIKLKVENLSSKELNEEYKKIIIRQQSYLGSLKGDIRGLENVNKDSIYYYNTYATATETYNFSKEAIEKGEPKKMKINLDARHSKLVDIKDIFIDSVKRIAILEEYIKRN